MKQVKQNDDGIRCEQEIGWNRISISGLFSAMGFLVCVLTLIGFAGGWFWIFDLASPFRVQYAVLLFLMGTCFLFTRYRRVAVTFLMFGLINVWTLLPFFTRDSAVSSVPSPESIRLLAWNIHSDNRDYEEWIRVIEKTQPDQILLMEVSPHGAAFLDGNLKEFPYRLVQERDDNFGIAFFSRKPFEMLRILELGMAGLPSIQADIKVGEQVVAFLGTHPLPPVGPRRAGMRNEQLESIARWVKDQPNPVIVVGDLNITPWSPVFKSFIDSTDLKNSAEGRGIQATWPTFFKPLMIPIDHCLHSKGVRIHSRDIPAAKGSDHLPQLIEYSLDLKK